MQSNLALRLMALIPLGCLAGCAAYANGANTLAPSTNVTPRAWPALTTALSRMIATRRAAAITGPPTGSAAASLLSFDPSGSLLQWDYRNSGDYDQNGEVNVSDLTPLGIHYAQAGPFAAGSIETVVDGDGNGEINISDLTPIGKAMGCSMTGYHVYASADQADVPADSAAANGAGAQLLATVGLASGSGNGRRQFTYTLASAPAGTFYWVRPTDGAQDGSASNSLSSDDVEPGAKDTYANFADLAAHETAGVDYGIVLDPRPGPLAVIAIHAGGIELGASEMARGLADATYSLYLFEGLKPSGNSVLHVTAANFDEPQGRALVAGKDYCVSIHGCSGTTAAINVGGRDAVLRDAVAAALDAAGFNALVPGDPGFLTNYGGTGTQNICNTTARGMGVQLEITRAQREAFFSDINSFSGRQTHTAAFDDFIAALQAGIATVVP